MDLLNLVKYNLQLTFTNQYDGYLEELLEVAEIEIKREGVMTLSPDTDAGDRQLIIMYAAYLYRLRAAQSTTTDSSNNKYFATTSNNKGIMPHMLRRLLNNRIMQEKVQNAR